MSRQTLLLAIAAFGSLSLQPAMNDLLADRAIAIWTPALVATLALSLKSPAVGLIWAALAGLLSDCLQSPPLGIDLLTLTLVSFGARRALGGPAPRGPLASGLIVFLVTSVSLLASMSTRVLLQGAIVDTRELLGEAMRHSLGNVLAAWFIVAISRLPRMIWPFAARRTNGMRAM